MHVHLLKALAACWHQTAAAKLDQAVDRSLSLQVVSPAHIVCRKAQSSRGSHSDAGDDQGRDPVDLRIN